LANTVQIDIASGTPTDNTPTLKMEPRAALGVVMEGASQGQTSTADASAAASRWLAAHDGGLIDDAVRQHFTRHPEALVDLVKHMRAFAQSPTASGKRRRVAQESLARYGFDDESLRSEVLDRD
jgi:hypothetical protein